MSETSSSPIVYVSKIALLTSLRVYSDDFVCLFCFVLFFFLGYIFLFSFAELFDLTHQLLIVIKYCYLHGLIIINYYHKS